MKICYPYCDGEDDRIYEVRKEYDCPGGCWCNSAFILDGIDFDGFMSFEDTVYEYTNEICVEIVGNKFDGVINMSLYAIDKESWKKPEVKQ